MAVGGGWPLAASIARHQCQEHSHAKELARGSPAKTHGWPLHCSSVSRSARSVHSRHSRHACELSRASTQRVDRPGLKVRLWSAQGIEAALERGAGRPFSVLQNIRKKIAQLDQAFIKKHWHISDPSGRFPKVLEGGGHSSEALMLVSTSDNPRASIMRDACVRVFVCGHRTWAHQGTQPSAGAAVLKAKQAPTKGSAAGGPKYGTGQLGLVICSLVHIRRIIHSVPMWRAPCRSGGRPRAPSAGIPVPIPQTSRRHASKHYLPCRVGAS